MEASLYYLGRKVARKIHIENRYDQALKLIREYSIKRKTCMPIDVLLDLSDSVFIPIIENTNQLAFAYKVDERIEYYLRRYLKSNDIWGFIKNVLGKEGYSEGDAVNTDNSVLLGTLFSESLNLCPVTGGSTSGTTSYTPVNIYFIDGTGDCCTSSYYTFQGIRFIAVDTAPYLTTYSSSDVAPSSGLGSGNNVTLTGSITMPSCFPSNGLSVQLDVGAFAYTSYSGTCASSCPSDAGCGCKYVYQCGSTVTWDSCDHPILYYNINYTVLPNQAYSFWVQFSVS